MIPIYTENGTRLGWLPNDPYYPVHKFRAEDWTRPPRTGGATMPASIAELDVVTIDFMKRRNVGVVIDKPERVHLIAGFRPDTSRDGLTK